MAQALSQNKKNQSMECCKMFAAILVVFTHAPFPGFYGELICQFGRFSVPMFLAISGYFNWGANHKTIARRFLHILWLIVFSSVLYSACNGFIALVQGNSLGAALELENVLPRPASLMRWILLQVNPFSGHLWYLSAVLLCYGFLWVYVRFFDDKPADYRPFYLLGSFCGILLLIFSVILPWSGMDIHPYVFRNGWLLGITMFTLGLFFREYQDILRKSFHLTTGKLFLLFILGFAIVLWELRYGPGGERTLGHLIMAAALVLFLIYNPQLPIQNPAVHWLVNQFRALSTNVYILHSAVIKGYNVFLQYRMLRMFGDLEAWLKPLVVLVVTILASMAWTALAHLLRKRKPK